MRKLLDSPWPATGIALALTCVALGPVLGGTFQADDYNLFETFVDPTTAKVEWDRVADQFWPDDEGGTLRPFFRPLYSTVWAVAVATVGVDATALHAANLVLHLAATALCGLLCAAFTTRGAGLAAGLGAAFFGLHVAAVEPAAWISALNSALCVPLLLASALLHARTLGARRPGLRAASVALAAAALATKEDAWALPFYLVAIDLALRPDRWPLRELLARHAPFAVLLVGYAAVRTAALGFSALGGHGELFSSHVGSFAANLPYKAWRTFAPWDTSAEPTAWSAVLGVAAIAAAVTVVVPALARASLRRVGILALLLVASLGPGFANLVDARWQGARVLYVAIPPCALLLATGIAAARGRLRPFVVVAAAVVVTASFAASRARVAQWTEAWQQMRAFRGAVATLQRARPAEGPVALLSSPREHAGVPMVLPPFAHLVARRPWADSDAPALGIGYVLEAYPGAEALGGDAAVVRALAEAGIAIAFGPGGGALAEMATAAPASAWELRDDLLTATGPPSPFAVEALAVRADGIAERFRVALEGTAETSVGTVVGLRVEDGVSQATIDLSHDVRFLAAAALGGVRGLRVHATDAAGRALPVRVGEVLYRVPELALDARLDGAELAGPLVAPPAAARVVLLADSHAFAQPVEPGAPVGWDDAARRWLDARRAASPDGVVRYYFDAGTTALGRSALDAFRLRR